MRPISIEELGSGERASACLQQLGSAEGATVRYGEARPLIEELLAEQRTLTAVERFADEHARASVPSPGHGSVRYYRDLLPLSTPSPGEQYSFEVDLDSCTGCKACVAACHALNGLDPDEAWRDVGMLIGATSEGAIQQAVTTACHHCLEPGCLSGCPVRAYEKDPATGIVFHLDDQCIGCQYCVLMCPYDVPKYSLARGIVRKCDMCRHRLAVGEAPACVQACPNEAIAIRVIRRTEAACAAVDGSFLADAPDPIHTQPTTRYTSRRALAGLEAADHFRLAPQEAHLPLVLMLTLTQFAVGIFAATALAASVGDLRSAAESLPRALARALLVTGLVASLLHLGRPSKAWRAFLGVRTSWLSREIIVFGACAGLVGLEILAPWLAAATRMTGVSLPTEVGASLPALPVVLRWSIVLLGIAGVLCSAMIYHATRRAFWRFEANSLKFLGTAAVLGVATLFAVLSGSTPLPEIAERLAWTLVALIVLKLGVEAAVVRHLRAGGQAELKRSALLMTGMLGRVTGLRLACGVLGGVVLPLAVVSGTVGAGVALGVPPLCFLGELAERYLFFAAVAPARMPGGV